MPRLEIGYTWTAASAQRTGVNAESKLLLLTHAFEVLGCLAVEFRTHWHNHQSRTAIARLGAKQDGVLRNHRRLPDGSLRDTVVFSILDTEWPAVRNGLRHRLDRAGLLTRTGPPAYPSRRVRAADLPLIGAAALRARSAARVLRTLPTDAKDAALAAMADALVERTDEVLAANAADVEAAAAAGTPESVLDRLRLDAARVAGVAAALRELVALPDPVGDVVRGSRLPNGLQLRQVRVPLGVVGIVYEARPNVTVDAAGLCLKSGNAALLRGSASAFGTNTALVAVLTEAGAEGRAARGVRRAAAGRPRVGRGAAERPRHGRRRHPARGRGA